MATLRRQLATAFGVSWSQTFVAVPYAALPAKPAGAPASSVSLRSASMTVGTLRWPVSIPRVCVFV